MGVRVIRIPLLSWLRRQWEDPEGRYGLLWMGGVLLAILVTTAVASAPIIIVEQVYGRSWQLWVTIPLAVLFAAWASIQVAINACEMWDRRARS